MKNTYYKIRRKVLIRFFLWKIDFFLEKKHLLFIFYRIFVNIKTILSMKNVCRYTVLPVLMLMLAFLVSGCKNEKSEAPADADKEQVASPADDSSSDAKKIAALSTDSLEGDAVGDEEDADVAQEGVLDDPIEKKEWEEGVEMQLMGSIGDAPATLDMEGRKGFYSYEMSNGKVTRNLELESYDKKSGRVVLKALDKNTGKYIGRFDGKFEISCSTDDDGVEHWANSYCGEFTNYKGVKVDFTLYID